jgi:hypothetical protein
MGKLRAAPHFRGARYVPIVIAMRLALRKIAAIAFFGVAPVAVLTGIIAYNWHIGRFAPDFQHGLYRQAQGLIRSGVPFDPVHVLITGQNRVYTMTATLLALPFTALSATAASIVMTALLIVATLVTLAVLDVRDWRVYGAVFVAAPVMSSIQTANLTLLLGLLAALAWRLRDHRFAPGLLVGLACALEVYMWPLAIWLIATRRFASAFTSAAVGIASVLIIVPFGDPINYFRLAERNAAAMGTHAYSLYVLLGEGNGARAAWMILAAGVGLCALRASDRSSFTLAILATILFCPIVWNFFFAILIVPLAIARPRFGPLWLVLLVFWLMPMGTAAPWQIALALASALALVAAIVVRRPIGWRGGHPIGLAHFAPYQRGGNREPPQPAL